LTRHPELPPLVTRTGRAFYVAMTGTALAVGALQMYHVHAGLLTDYGADLFGTAWLYAMARSGRTIFQRGRVISATSAATIVFGLCTISEFGQRMHLVPGRYDPYDIATYAVAVLACWAFDRRFPLVAPLQVATRSSDLIRDRS
jgi:hypothetical protein